MNGNTYNNWIMRQAKIRCNPPLIKQACQDCHHWNKKEGDAGRGLCKQWANYTFPWLRCDFFTGRKSNKGGSNDD
jgi:hypothetical protein